MRVRKGGDGFIVPVDEWDQRRWAPDGTPIIGTFGDTILDPVTPFGDAVSPIGGVPPANTPFTKSGTDRRRTALSEVEGCVCRDRQNAYSDAEDNFQDIAVYWTQWLKRRGLLKDGAVVEDVDVAAMSGLIKVARASVNPLYRDNWIDGAGYSICGAGIAAKRSEASGGA